MHRTMSKEEILHLFDFGDDDNADAVLDQSQESSVLLNQDMTGKLGALKQKSLPLSRGSCSSDKFMDNLLSRYYPRYNGCSSCLNLYSCYCVQSDLPILLLLTFSFSLYFKHVCTTWDLFVL